jgi:hypothetical protein
MQDDFNTQIDRTTFLFVPKEQSHVDTATQILLRSPPVVSDLDQYSQLLGCSPGHVGQCHDKVSSCATLGRAGDNCLALATFGDCKTMRLQLLAAALKQVKPPTVLLDVVSLGFTADDVKSLAEKLQTKQFTVVVNKKKSNDQLAADIEENDANVEVVRNSASSACASRFRSGVPFCAAYHSAGPEFLTRGPFDRCDTAQVGLLNPLFVTTMLHHNTWIEV